MTAAPLPAGCICDPMDFAALGHMTNCPCHKDNLAKMVWEEYVSPLRAVRVDIRQDNREMGRRVLERGRNEPLAPDVRQRGRRPQRI